MSMASGLEGWHVLYSWFCRQETSNFTEEELFDWFLLNRTYINE